MSPRLEIAFALTLAAHSALASLVPSPWWVPDLSLVALVIFVARVPNWWLLLSGLAGVFVMAWAIRFPGPILIGYLLVGGMIRALSRRWDTADPRVEYLVVALASLCMTCGALWLENLWSVPLLGLAALHIAVTGAAVPFVRRLAVGGS